MVAVCVIWVQPVSGEFILAVMLISIPGDDGAVTINDLLAIGAFAAIVPIFQVTVPLPDS